MAIVKHIKSRNANYSAAINYLLFEHDEKTGKKIVDESGRSILRKEFYMDGLNCDPMSFDKECELTPPSPCRINNASTGYQKSRTGVIY